MDGKLANRKNELWHRIRFTKGLAEQVRPIKEFSMMLLEELTTRDLRVHSFSRVRLPEIRPSFLDPHLACEPWIDACECECEQVLVLFILNRPIALLPGSSLDHVSLNTLMMQLRHRAPRQQKTVPFKSRIPYDG